MKMSNEARFWRYVDRTPTCWLWTGAVDHAGYGRFWANRRNVGAHRFSLGIATGKMPERVSALHSCDNPPCVNPAHLRWGTMAENVRDSVAHGKRSGDGVAAWATKLTRADAEEIRRLLASGWSKEGLGRRFGVSAKMVRRIELGECWA